MGVACFPDIFQATMSELMTTLEFMRTYLDDLLCISNGSMDDHLTKLQRVFIHLQNVLLKVNAFKYCFCAVVNVIPEFPPQSPEPPVIADKFHEADPAPVISLKSTFEAVIVPLQVMVRGVPMVLDDTRSLFSCALYPEAVNSLITVGFVLLIVQEGFDSFDALIFRL